MSILAPIIRPFKLNSSRVYLESFLVEAASQLSQNERVLDAGAGDGKYKRIFDHCHYYSTDIRQVEPAISKVSFISDLAAVPIISHYYDLAICNQVLEHVPDPKKVVHELFRLLKKNGEVWITAPLYYEEHSTPDDYFRFTQYGISLLIESAGFKIRKIAWLEGYFGTLSYELRKAARELPVNPRRIGNPFTGTLIAVFNLFLKPIFFLLSVLFSYVDISHKYTHSGNCKNYAVIAVKPET